MKITDINDLNALYKTLLLAKFPVDSSKAFEISGSKIVVNLLERVANEMNVQHDLFIDNDNEKLSYVKGLILSKPELQRADKEIRKEVIENIIFPYKCSDVLMSKLMGSVSSNISF